MEELYNLLKQVDYTKNSWNRKKIIGNIGKSCAFGYLQIPFKRVGYSNKTLNQFDLYKKLLNWGKKYLPESFEFNCIYCNYNMKAKKHKDSLNVGDSYFCFIGDCSGGELKIYDKEDEDREIYRVKKNELYCFNGYEKYHETDNFNGERYSIIFYKNNFYHEQKIIDEGVYCLFDLTIEEIKNKLVQLKHINRKKIFIFCEDKNIDNYRKLFNKKLYNRILRFKNKHNVTKKEFIKSLFPKSVPLFFISN